MVARKAGVLRKATSRPSEIIRNRTIGSSKGVRYDHLDVKDHAPPLKLRARIVQTLRTNNINANGRAVDQLLMLFQEQLQTFSALHPSTTSAEPFPGLRLSLPPQPRTPFKQSRLDIETFFEREWGDYTQYSLLYSEHLRHIDPGLYRACRHRAQTLNKTVEQFFFALGVLTQRHVKSPPKGREWAAGILNQVRRARITATYEGHAEAIRGLVAFNELES